MRLALTQAFQGFHSIQSGHLDIQDHDIGIEGIGFIQCFPTVCCRLGFPALVAQCRSK